MSMFQKSTAKREKVKLMVGFAGPSGAGKTWSALQVAYGITGDWSKITVLDTENRSALYYADRMEFGPFEHVPFEPTIPGGYDPRNYIKAIEYAESDPNCEVILVDSISHEWEGVGGCLDMVDRIGKGFSGWKNVTPLHNEFIDKMRHSRCHILATMRTKTDYAVEQVNGKTTPKKVGLKANTREGTDYEFGIIFDIEISHYATASKDRTGLFMGRGPTVLTADVGKQLLSWANSGAQPKPHTQEAIQQRAGATAKAQEPSPPPAQPAEAPKNASNAPTIFEGTDEQRNTLAGILRRLKIPESHWDEIESRLMGKPSTELHSIIKPFQGGAK